MANPNVGDGLAPSIAVIGSTGFIGSATTDALSNEACKILKIGRIDLKNVIPDSSSDAAAIAEGWACDNTESFDQLVLSLATADVVINAAGMAAPDSTDKTCLARTNTILPLLLAKAMNPSSRLIHVSSAAVQGRRLTLDESSSRSPFSAYSLSKADAEAALEQTDLAGQGRLTIYRPTSVQGVGRPTTRRLIQVLNSPMAAQLGAGTVPLPLALVQNVGAAIAFLALNNVSGPIVLHPSEQITQAALYEIFRDGRPRRLPGSTERLLRPAASIASRVPFLSGPARRAELLMLGQETAATQLADAGFVPPVGLEGYRALAGELALH